MKDNNDKKYTNDMNVNKISMNENNLSKNENNLSKNENKGLRKKKKDPYKKYRINQPLDRTKIPSPIFDENKDFIEFYWKAWELAWAHVIVREDMPSKTYMDEAMTPNQIWIWDTCFMALFSRYGWKLFPGVESLDNFYQILYDGKKSKVKIHFADNPPLFSWIEYEYFKFTGDLDRVKRVLLEKNYLQEHFDFIENAKRRKKPKNVLVKPVALREPLGYRWKGNTSGMDNTPRGRNNWNNTKLNRRGQIMHNNIYFVDLLAQQALSAYYIVKLFDILLDSSEITETQKDSIKNQRNIFEARYDELKNLLNQYYWDSKEKFYFDIEIPKKALISKETINSNNYKELQEKIPIKFNRVKTLASFWPLLCLLSDNDKAEELKEYTMSENEFGGKIPLPSLSRNDPEFDPKGRYWRGGIWLPTGYMTIKALEKYNYYKEADILAFNLLMHMLETYHKFKPHTIWEAYSPSAPKPSTTKTNSGYVRENFCGWSALGPISLFIENVLGFHEINAIENKVIWRLNPTFQKKYGIKNLIFGSITASLIFNPENNELNIVSNAQFSLYVWKNDCFDLKKFDIAQGENVFKLN